MDDEVMLNVYVNKMNRISKPLDELFIRLATLQGTLYHIQFSLIGHSKDYTKRIEKVKENIPDFALGTNLVISDVTGPTDRGWEYIFPTRGQHIVKLSEFNQEIEKLIRRETAYTLSQSFEAFSTFLKNQIAAFLEVDSTHLEKIKPLKDAVIDEYTNWKEKVRKINSGKNNHELFKILRLFAPNLELSEKKNNKLIDFPSWYKSLAFMRHITIHSNSSFSLNNKDYLNLTKIEKEYLEEYFPFEDKDDNNFFMIERKLGNHNLKILSEYAFLIFKELSIELNEDWMILKYMKEKNTEQSKHYLP